MKRPYNIEIKRSLQIAYERIKNDDYEFICHALEDTPAEDYLKYFIHNAMGKERSGWYNHETLNAWVLEHVGYYPKYSEMKAYRLRWIKYMMEGL